MFKYKEDDKVLVVSPNWGQGVVLARKDYTDSFGISYFVYVPDMIGQSECKGCYWISEGRLRPWTELSKVIYGK